MVLNKQGDIFARFKCICSRILFRYPGNISEVGSISSHELKREKDGKLKNLPSLTFLFTHRKYKKVFIKFFDIA